MSNEAKRNNEGKPKLSYCLLGKEVIAGKAKVWEFGATKYDKGNWLKGRAWTDCADSVLRHLKAFLNGENIDEDSGLLHIDLLGCSVDILANSVHTRPDLDDRAVFSSPSMTAEEAEPAKLVLTDGGMYVTRDGKIVKVLKRNLDHDREWIL